MRALVLVTSAFALFVVTACSAGVAPDSDGGLVGTSTPSGNGNGSTQSGCALAAGTYKVHTSTTTLGGQGMCMSVADSTVTIANGVDAGVVPNSACNTTTAGCMSTVDCSTVGNASSTDTKTTLTTAGTSASGSTTTKVTDAKGNTVLDCRFDFTYTMQ